MNSNLKVFALYALVGFGSVGAAFYVSSLLVEPSQSEEALAQPPNPFLTKRLLLAQNTVDVPPPPEPPSTTEEAAMPAPPPPVPPGEMEEVEQPAAPVENQQAEQMPNGAPPPPPSDPAIEGQDHLLGKAVNGEKENQPPPPPPKEDYELFLETYNYDPSGRRDPFVKIENIVNAGIRDSQQRPLLPLERYDLSEIRLIGIVWSVKKPRAMFLDPTNKVHVLGTDQRIGRNQGYIAVIREGEVIVVETTEKAGEAVYQTKVLRLERDKT